MDYTTVIKVSQYLKRDLSTDESATLNWLIPSVTSWIDATLGTTFKYKDPTTYETRYFKGGYQYLNIDPCQTIQSVYLINNYDAISYQYNTWEYIAEPNNSVVKDSLFLRGFKFAAGMRRISITANFTEYDYVLGKVPDDIALLATHIATVWLQNSESSNGIIREQIEGHMVMRNPKGDFLVDDPMVQRVLNSRQRVWLED